MNKINFSQTGGFPLETETLLKMQLAYESLQKLGNMAGNKSIVSGCTVSGSTTSDGFIFLNDELLYFEGGVTQSTIVIVESAEAVEYEDGQTKDTYITRKAVFGTGVTTFQWSHFKRLFPATSALFIDEIRMFAGSVANLPSGWFLCDGTNNTANLKGRFVVGFDAGQTDYNAIGKTGGAKQVTLTANQIPAHKHSFVADSDYGGSHTTVGLGGGNSTDKNIETSSSGGGSAHENRPPFYTLAFIQFKGI
jgi:microcystin-dependent protein